MSDARFKARKMTASGPLQEMEFTRPRLPNPVTQLAEATTFANEGVDPLSGVWIAVEPLPDDE
ncbi:hypothetical protein BJI67_15730 (plasmid) [Acidihalobacter aeolianus]|uniref:Uncharacterized protein n=1 Tax=Acidihalobacter aeolianus TaxID=2792603 RepID=A0A1D8KCM6_9GAMM|nr:hypothetical protein [Acidihalobacter aeolianus]AOV18696.1 hypothetical protein BJI67_15730 [Acidihalobacter aeolianus]